MERRAIFTFMLFIFAYLISWAPYAIMSLCSVFGLQTGRIDPIFGFLPGLIAKSSMLWTSTFYIVSNKSLRDDISLEPIRALKTKILDQTAGENLI